MSWGSQKVDNRSESSANEIIPNLWLGNFAASQSPEFFDTAGIKAVINATNHIPNKWGPRSGRNVEYFKVPINDPGPTDSEDQEDNVILAKYMPDAVEFIRKHLDAGHPVLVHCHAGRIRSASIVLCYLVQYIFSGNIRNRVHQALALMLSTRPCVFHYGEYSSFTPTIARYVSSLPIG